MPISGISTDYSTRTKDIHIFQGVNVQKRTDIAPSFGRISNYCSGVQKLVQRYGVILLTELGSQIDFVEFGTELITTLLRSSSAIGRGDVNLIFAKANVRVLDILRNYQRNTPGLPLDEQIDTAVLNDVVVTGDSIALDIQIFTLSGGEVVFLLPLPSIK